MNYTQLMYDAAHSAYERNNEVHAYSGLVHGLSAVAKVLGFDLPWQYFSDRHHDPLVSLADIFGKETITFEELVRMWDSMWFGLGTGRFRELPFPYGEPERVHVAGGYHPLNLDWIKNKVLAKLKELKIRRGTKKHEAFVAEHARKVVDATVSDAAQCAQATARDLLQGRAKVVNLAAKSHEKHSKLAAEQELRQALLDTAGLAGSPAVDFEMGRRLEAWAIAAKAFDGKVDLIDSQLASLADENLVSIGAVEALSRDDVLAPFPRALGLVS